MTVTAFEITSAGRLWPLGVRGMLSDKHNTFAVGGEGRMWKLPAAMVVVSGVLIQSYIAQAGQGRTAWTAYGLADVSCGRFTSPTGNERASYEWWVAGFLSGAGYGMAETGKPLAETDTGGLVAWVSKHCTENPLDTIVKAAISLVNELERRAS